MAAPPRDFFKTLPAELPPDEPYYYLSAAQRSICEQKSALAVYAPHLPGWVPHRQVANALGHKHDGIDAALRKLGGRPYVWGTEFENVHSLWSFTEPHLTIDGQTYHCSEDYFHKKKPSPFDKRVWDGDGPGLGRRDKVMEQAVRLKFADPVLRELLIASYPHQLLSIKGDRYWGVTPAGVGENALARIEMELREELVLSVEAAGADGARAKCSVDQVDQKEPDGDAADAVDADAELAVKTGASA